MEALFPLFLKDRDGWMYLIQSIEDSGRIEKFDIESGEYSGWDIEGKPIDLRMQSDGILFSVSKEAIQSLNELKAAIISFANREGPKGKQFQPEDSNDVLKLFLAADLHVCQPRWRGRITSLFNWLKSMLRR